MVNTPFFSVLIPSYNRPEFVGAAVSSVLASDFTDFEVVVSDDCSPRQAEIRAVLAPLTADPRLRFFAQESNLREPANRAFLQTQAAGTWQVLLSDDDLLYPGALRALAAAITEHPGTHLFTFGYTLIDEHDRVAYSRRAPRSLSIQRDGSPVLVREFLTSDAFPYWFYQPATFCCHRSVRDRITPNSGIGMGDDLQFLFDYVNDGGVIGVLPEVLMCYRKMNATATHLQLNQSGKPLSNPLTRYKMMAEMEGRSDLCPAFRAVILTPEFRRRFVYNPLLTETRDLEHAVQVIGMTDVHRAELFEWRRHYHPGFGRVQSMLRRCWFFVRLFGPRGAGEIARVTAERLLPPPQKPFVLHSSSSKGLTVD